MTPPALRWGAFAAGHIPHSPTPGCASHIVNAIRNRLGFIGVDIPKSVLDKADCVVILPSVLKFSLGLGSSYGRGVMTCRGGKTFHGSWSAPTMMALAGASAGLQIGGNATDFVLLLMSPRSASRILTSKVKLGGDATAAAGPVGRTASAETDVTMRAEILSYSRARGLFAGISLAGSTLRPDNGANKNLYGKEVSARRPSSSIRPCPYQPAPRVSQPRTQSADQQRRTPRSIPSRLGSTLDSVTSVDGKLKLRATNKHTAASECSSERSEVLFDQAALRV